jgi:predicted Zn finger-like uncharacterized protein
MIIICPACDTKFMVSATAMGEQGRTVRCAKCAHQWHAMPHQEHYELNAAAASEPAPKDDFFEAQPNAADENADDAEMTPDDFDYAKAEAMAASLAEFTLVKAVPLAQQPIWKVTAAALLLACALVLGLIMRESLVPPLGKVFKSFGYYPEDGVTLADVSLKQLPTRPREDSRYDILCTIVNQTGETRRIPQLAMRIMSKDGFVLAEDDNFLRNSGENLPPGQRAACKGLRFANPFSTATHVVVDLGSPMELSLRSDWTVPADEDEEEEAEAEAEAKTEEKPVSETPFKPADKPAEKEVE